MDFLLNHFDNLNKLYPKVHISQTTIFKWQEILVVGREIFFEVLIECELLLKKHHQQTHALDEDEIFEDLTKNFLEYAMLQLPNQVVKSNATKADLVAHAKRYFREKEKLLQPFIENDVTDKSVKEKVKEIKNQKKKTR